MLRIVFLRAAIVVLMSAAIGTPVTERAIAAPVTPAPNPIGTSSWTVSAPFTQSWYSNQSKTDFGTYGTAKVEVVLESWIGKSLTFAGGGTCAFASNCIPNDLKGGSWTFSGKTAQVIGVQFGNQFLAFLFATPVNSFSIANLTHGVNSIFAYSLTYNLNPVPLPAALWLMGSVLVGWLGLNRWFGRRAGA